ncbi:MAG: hypothetical protein F9K29_08040 [Hyphomicrobiaceae bacterium]|nr:MAG: hypothetical protein F9K29_08040 [Hyphomicrobiaceae bacterium]
MDACCCPDLDGPSVFDERLVKAKKAHKCTECCGVILPGEMYLKTWGIWEGEAHTFKRCADCIDLVKWAEAHVPCICWLYGETHSNIRDAMDEWDRECPGLAAEADAKIKAVRAKRRELQISATA